MRESTGMGGHGEAHTVSGRSPMHAILVIEHVDKLAHLADDVRRRGSGVKGREGERETNGEGEREGGAQG